MQSHTHMRLNAGRASAEPRRGFTLVEVLVTTAIIVLLLSLLLVGLNLARNSARGASTRSLMQSISQAITQFKTDHGYHPVLLRDRDGLAWNTPGWPVPAGGTDGTARGYLPPPALPGTPTAPGPESNETFWSRSVMQQWYSITALPEFLLGYGGRLQDGYGGSPNELPPLGIRWPGADGSWGGSVPDTSGRYTLAARRPLTPESGGRAQVYGPYLDLYNTRLIGSFNGEYQGDNAIPVAYAPGENGYDPDGPKVFLDAWGSPIQYFRRHYSAGNPAAAWRSNYDNNRNGQVGELGSAALDPERGIGFALDAPPRLSEVFRLRPWSIGIGQDSIGRSDGSNADQATSRALDTAEFALFSPGPDRLYSVNRRRDDRAVSGTGIGPAYNQDNIVEIGP